jgi:dTDP-4-dehydrorhamnose reductase
MSLRVMVLGSNGMLGKYLQDIFTQESIFYVPITRREFDCEKDSYKSLHILIKQKNISYVVNCIGFHNKISSPEATRSLFNVNSWFPRQLANYLQQDVVRFIHISTNAVFSGLDGNYTESHIPDSEDTYGRSKYLGEAQNAMVIRTSIIGRDTVNKRHLVEWLLQQQGKTIQGYTDHFWNGITAKTLAQAIANIITHDYYYPVLLHLHSSTSLSKYDLLNILIQYHQLNIQNTPIQAGLMNLTLQSNNPLSTTLSLPTIETQLQELVSEYIF